MNQALQKARGYLVAQLLHPRFYKFALVGGIGVGVNMGMLFLLTEWGHLHYALSSIFAIETSIFSNFTLNDLWTWRDREKKSYWKRLLQYHISVGFTALVVNWGLLVFLTAVVGLHYLISNLIGIGAGTLLNYTINDLWTFRNREIQ